MSTLLTQNKSHFIYTTPSPPPSYKETFPETTKLNTLTKYISTKPHPLDTSLSHLLLKTTLDPLIKLSKYIGIFPMELDQEGVAVCGLLNFSTLFYLSWALVFITLSAFYSPLYLQLMISSTGENQDQKSIHTIAKYLFVCGQFVTACTTLLIVPRLAFRTTSFYNKLNTVIKTLGDSIREPLKAVFWKARCSIIFWFLIVSSSWYLWWNSFHSYFRKEFKDHDDSNKKQNYYVVVCGALSLATLISGHIVPSFVYLGFVGVLRVTYQSIYKQKPSIKVGMMQYTNDFDKLTILVDIFTKLNTQVNRLGEIFGRYLILEMGAFFTAVLTNSFSILTGFEKGSVNLETSVISIVVNFLWFFTVCEAGEAVGREQKRCLKMLKNWIVGGSGSNNNSAQATWLITTLLGDDVRGVTAASYFNIKRTLATQAVATIVMYLIVMLQFKTTGNCGD